MSSNFCDGSLADALARLGQNAHVREQILDTLRQAEQYADDPLQFQREVRWRVLCALLRDVPAQPIVLEQGLIYEATLDSRIEQAVLLSAELHPDHVWEPQTTKLLTTLARETDNVIVGGAYAGDQVLLIAHALADRPAARVHAFEPMAAAFRRLERHAALNELANVCAFRLALWDRSGILLSLEGDAAVASTVPLTPAQANAETVETIRIDDYVREHSLRNVGLIMLDLEGGEEHALRGARELLAHSAGRAPHLVFEVHRNYVDWSGGLEQTEIVRFLVGFGYTLFAIRDYHDNHRMTHRPIEIIPLAHVYLDGPPHGFNLLATQDANLIPRLGLRVVASVSPKLITGRDPRLHAPMDGIEP